MKHDGSSKHAKSILKTFLLIRREWAGCIYLEWLNVLLPHVPVLFPDRSLGLSIRLMYLQGINATHERPGRTIGRVRRRKIPAINEAGYEPSIFIAERPSTLYCTRGEVAAYEIMRVGP